MRMLSSPSGSFGPTVRMKQRPSVYGVLSSRWMTAGMFELSLIVKLASLQKRESGILAFGVRYFVSIERASPSIVSVKASSASQSLRSARSRLLMS